MANTLFKYLSTPLRLKEKKKTFRNCDNVLHLKFEAVALAIQHCISESKTYGPGAV